MARGGQRTDAKWARMYLNPRQLEYFRYEIGDVCRSEKRLIATFGEERAGLAAAVVVAVALVVILAGVGGEVAQFIRDLEPCVRQREPIGVHIPHAVEYGSGRFRMQLPDLEGDDAPLRIHGHGKRQHEGGDAEAFGGLVAFLLAHEHRVLDPDLFRVLQHRLLFIDGDADDFQLVRSTFATKRVEQRDLLTARPTPGRPEIDDQRPTLPAREASRRAGAIGQGDVRQNLGNRGWRW